MALCPLLIVQCQRETHAFTDDIICPEFRKLERGARVKPGGVEIALHLEEFQWEMSCAGGE